MVQLVMVQGKYINGAVSGFYSVRLHHCSGYTRSRVSSGEPSISIVFATSASSNYLASVRAVLTAIDL
jgi:hypothetical protein